ncbi:hypothetical protein GB937_006767 [Aspergillus fischeri]|nr:hypothetical protein GB937_006767 [Aspergillus fischeri]
MHFAGAGLVPFNPDRTPTPPGSRSTNSAPKTPYTIRQLEKQASATKKLLRECAHSPLPLLELRLDKIIKGHELTLNELVLTREEIRRSHAENEWKGQKRKRSTRQLAITEGLAIQEGLELFQHENKVDKGQDALPIDPALSAVGPRV